MGRTSSSLKWMAMPSRVAEQDLVLAGGEHGLDERVVVLHAEGDDAAGARVREGAELGLLHDALAGGEQHVAAGVELLHGAEGGDLLAAAASCTRFTTALPLPCGPDVGDLVDLQPVDAPAVGEDQDVGVGGGDEELVDEVLVLASSCPCGRGRRGAGAVGGDRGALDVAGVGDGDGHVLVGDQVLDRDLVHRVQDLGAARVAVVVADLLAARRRRSRRCAPGLARMSLRSAMRTVISFSSSTIFWRSRPVRRCSCSSRMASAWISRQPEAARSGRPAPRRRRLAPRG